MLMIVDFSRELWEMVGLGLANSPLHWKPIWVIGLVFVVLLHLPPALMYTAQVGKEMGMCRAYLRVWFSLLINLRISPWIWKPLDGAWLCLWLIAHLPAVCWLGLLYWFVMAWEVR